mmetsp:Transcript_6080/g.13727  ORF Transcript_6080/g.13727 Transcript_6080/m.13727 type:complete len:296 (+) Transcript_6080:329-1216(+)
MTTLGLPPPRIDPRDPSPSSSRLAATAPPNSSARSRALDGVLLWYTLSSLSLAAAYAAARAVPPPPRISAASPATASVPTRRERGLYTPLQSVLSPMSTRVPNLSFLTMTVFTLPISLAASVRTSTWSMIDCLCGMVTEHPPKLASFHIGPSTNSCTVSTSARTYVCGSFAAANAPPCICGLTLYAMFRPRIAYRSDGIWPVRSRPAMISAAVSWPGAATDGRLSCVTGVNRRLSIRLYDPVSPRTSPMLGTSGPSSLAALFPALCASWSSSSSFESMLSTTLVPCALPDIRHWR